MPVVPSSCLRPSVPLAWSAGGPWLPSGGPCCRPWVFGSWLRLLASLGLVVSVRPSVTCCRCRCQASRCRQAVPMASRFREAVRRCRVSAAGSRAGGPLLCLLLASIRREALRRYAVVFLSVCGPSVPFWAVWRVLALASWDAKKAGPVSGSRLRFIRPILLSWSWLYGFAVVKYNALFRFGVPQNRVPVCACSDHVLGQIANF